MPITPAGKSEEWTTEVAVPREVKGLYIMPRVEWGKTRLFMNYDVGITDKEISLSVHWRGPHRGNIRQVEAPLKEDVLSERVYFFKRVSSLNRQVKHRSNDFRMGYMVLAFAVMKIKTDEFRMDIITINPKTGRSAEIFTFILPILKFFAKYRLYHY